MRSSSELLSESLDAASRAGLWLARALVIALAGIAAAVMAVLAFALQSTGSLLMALAGFVTAALPVVLGVVPGLARLLCLGFALGATAYAGWLIFEGFGGDWLALALAFLLAPAPFLTLYAPIPTWPRAVAAGMVALAGAGLTLVGPPLLRMFALFILFAWLLTRRMHKEFHDAGSNQGNVAEG